VVTTPDFLFTAMDMAAGPAGLPTVPFGSRSLTFNEDNVLPGLAGPGTITTPTVFTYNKASPVYFNSSSGVMNGTPYFTSTPGSATNSYYLEYYLWANFDGTTNAPVVFPNGTSLENLQNLIIAQVTPRPGELANGYVGAKYTPVSFIATAGAFTQPFTWQADALPEGMTLTPDGELSGKPVLAGTYDFTLTLTDAVGRTVSWDFSLKIETTILSSN
jgi:hypothetical protein